MPPKPAMPPLLPPPDTRDLPCRDGCTPMWSAASWDSSVPVDTAASTASASFSEPSPSEPTTTTCKPAFWLPSLLNNLSTYDTLTLSAGSCRDLAKLASNVDVRLGVKASASMPATSRLTTTADDDVDKAEALSQDTVPAGQALVVESKPVHQPSGCLHGPLVPVVQALHSTPPGADVPPVAGAPSYVQ